MVDYIEISPKCESIMPIVYSIVDTLFGRVINATGAELIMDGTSQLCRIYSQGKLAFIGTFEFLMDIPTIAYDGMENALDTNIRAISSGLSAKAISISREGAVSLSARELQ